MVWAMSKSPLSSMAKSGNVVCIEGAGCLILAI